MKYVKGILLLVRPKVIVYFFFFKVLLRKRFGEVMSKGNLLWFLRVPITFPQWYRCNIICLLLSHFRFFRVNVSVTV